MEEFYSEAFGTIMHVIHGKNILVPRKVCIDCLGKIAAAAYVFQCQDALRLAVEVWFGAFPSLLLNPPTAPLDRRSLDEFLAALPEITTGRHTIDRDGHRVAQFCDVQSPIEPSVGAVDTEAEGLDTDLFPK